MKVNTLSVVIGDGSCNFSCPYCVSKMTGIEEPEELGYLEPTPGGFYWRNLHKSCELAARSGVHTCLLTGKGEPTLWPKWIGHVVKKVSQYFPVVELQTNGQKLMRIEERDVHTWYLDGLTTIAISMVHYDENVNQRLLYPHGAGHANWNSKIADRMHQLGFSVRLSVIMCRGYIWNPDTVQVMCGAARDIFHAEQLTLVPVTRPDSPRDEDVAAWVEEHRLFSEQLEEVKTFLDENAVALQILPHGAVVYDYEDQNVCLSNCLTLDAEAGEENLRQLIYFPDGSLRYDWRYPGARIF